MLGAGEIILIKTVTIPAHTEERKQEEETNKQTKARYTRISNSGGNYNSSIHVVLKLLLNSRLGDTLMKQDFFKEKNLIKVLLLQIDDETFKSSCRDT